MIAASATGGSVYAQSAESSPVAYRGFLDSGFMFGDNNADLNYWWVNTTHGVSLLHDRLFLGAGIGLGLPINYDESDTYMLPAYFDARYTYQRRRITPFVDMKIGYTHIWKPDAEDMDGGSFLKGGFYISPSVGVSFPVGKICLEAMVGYSYISGHRNVGLHPFESRRINYKIDGFNFGIGLSW